MSLLRKIFKIRRKLHGAIWRRILSRPAKRILELCFGTKVAGEMQLIGWPLFKGDGQIIIGRNCVLVSNRNGNPIGLVRPCTIEAVWKHSTINIGNEFSASGVCIVSEENIMIGNNVSLGANVTIIDTDFHAIDFKLQSSGLKVKCKPIHIEDNVWIGMNVVILKGVRIGQGAIIGANSVVTKDVPANTCAVGNPAVIKIITREDLQNAC